jgi:TnpA family transposase
VLGGILDNDTALAIREHASDTHGFTEHLCGLCVLLGITFMPRLKDLPDQVLSRIDRDADYGALQPLLRGRINGKLILEQWDQLVRLAASLKDRLTPAHVVMQRLVNANASDRLAGALSQLGRLMKTLHILRATSRKSRCVTPSSCSSTARRARPPCRRQSDTAAVGRTSPILFMNETYVDGILQISVTAPCSASLLP